MHRNNMDNKLDSILRPNGQPDEGGKFYQLIRVDNAEHYLELRFRNGIKTAFAYDKLGWFNYSPDSTGLELDFMGVTVIVIGRGLGELFQPLKGRRVSWIKEADTDLQDNDSNSIFISELFIVPPASELQNEEPTP